MLVINNNISVSNLGTLGQWLNVLHIYISIIQKNNPTKTEINMIQLHAL